MAGEAKKEICSPRHGSCVLGQGHEGEHLSNYAAIERIREIVDGAKDGPAIAWLTAFADVRDLFHPDSEAARIRRAELAKKAAGREWKGV